MDVEDRAGLPLQRQLGLEAIGIQLGGSQQGLLAEGTAFAQQAAQKIGGAAGNRPGSEAERQAAERAGERIQARLKQLEAEEPPIEVRFTLSDQWSRHLFVALLRRYGIRPYRYRGQRRTTVMARLSRSFVNDTLWPEFLELQSTLAAYFDALTDRVIEQALGVKAGEAEEQLQTAPQLPPQEHQWSLL